MKRYLVWGKGNDYHHEIFCFESLSSIMAFEAMGHTMHKNYWDAWAECCKRNAEKKEDE